jgi:hypothetical protein
MDDRPPSNAILGLMMKDISNIKDRRSLVLTVHLFVEYWLNWMIRKHFKNHEEILEDDSRNELKSFSNKAKMLHGLGVLEGDVYKDVRTINRIRNIFAHRIDLDNPEVQKEFEKEVNNIGLDSEELRPILNDVKAPPQNRLVVMSLRVMIELQQIYFIGKVDWAKIKKNPLRPV